jgi:hypothetical protein
MKQSQMLENVMKSNPELGNKILEKQFTGGKGHH